VRDGDSLDHLKARFSLGPPPDLIRLGLYDEGFRFDAQAITEPVWESFLKVQATVQPERGRMTDSPKSNWYLDTYNVSFDGDGRLHSVNDEPATFLHDHQPSGGSLSATYYVHGEVGRANDLPDMVAILLPSRELHHMIWSVPSRPDDAPTSISQNGQDEYGFSWEHGRSDGPTVVRRYDRLWSRPSGEPWNKWILPTPAVYDIAYMAADPLTDADARLLVEQFDTLEPHHGERALLARTLLRWQPRLSEGTRAWLHTLA